MELFQRGEDVRERPGVDVPAARSAAIFSA